MLNIVEEIFSNARPEAIAILSEARSITFGQLEQMTSAAAASLDLRAGQRVGIHCPNSIDHIVWSLAILKHRAVLTPVAPELSPVERDTLVETTGIDVILCGKGTSWHKPLPQTRQIEVEGLAPAALHDGWLPAKVGFDPDKLNALNPALIRFSSGTTGKRKGVVLSHETLLGRVRASNSGLKIGPEDRVIWILPMAHHFAVSIVLYLLHGATTVIELSHLGADVFGALEKHEGTVLYASPFHYALLGAYEHGHPVKSLRLAVSTAAALPEATAIKFNERYGLPLSQALGIIECGLPLLNTQWPLAHPDSVGAPQQGYEAAIRDIEGHDLPDGELSIRGPGLVDAYLSPWLSKDEILSDGWFKTGDMARRDAEGAIYLTGRSHSVINVGGMKCFPEEVEATLNDHPAISESRVSGMAHATFGTVPVAEIVPVDAAAPPKISEIIAHCRTRLSSYKLPVKYTFVAAIPKTANGKTQR